MVAPKIMKINCGMRITISQASAEWLAERKTLSPATTKSYSGEIDRLGQFVAAEFKFVELAKLRVEHWERYLSAMQESRAAISSRRSRTLKASSVTQAMRITRQFLVWCAERRLIDWWPQRVAVPVTQQDFDAPGALPDDIRLLLAGHIQAGSVEDARSILVMNLAYWASLDSGEIAMLKVRHLILTPQAVLTHPLTGSLLVLPTHIRRVWAQYAKFRRADVAGDFNEGSPLISRLKTNEPLRAWAIWSLVKAWHGRNGNEVVVSPRMLRSAFIDAITIEERTRLGAVLAHVGNRGCSVTARATEDVQLLQRMQGRQLRRLVPA